MKVGFESSGMIGEYRFIRQIEKGSSSIVMLVEHIMTNVLYACKIFDREFLVSSNLTKMFENELCTLKKLKHPNIAQLIDVLYDESRIYCIIEYCKHGELLKYIVSSSKLDEMEAKRLFVQILAAVDFCHRNGVVHRDLKPENILLGSEMDVKLIDFGLCHTSGQLLSTACGSVYYAPPEVILGMKYDGEKGDIWSLGVVLYIMVAGRMPWTAQNPNQVMNQIVNCEYSIPNDLSFELQQVIISMLNQEPNKRPSIENIISSSWFKAETLPPIIKSKSSLVPRTSEYSKRSLVFAPKLQTLISRSAHQPKGSPIRIPVKHRPQ